MISVLTRHVVTRESRENNFQKSSLVWKGTDRIKKRYRQMSITKAPTATFFFDIKNIYTFIHYILHLNIYIIHLRIAFHNTTAS